MSVNLPNTITIMRLLMVPLVVWLIITSAYSLAFVIFAVAGFSDAIDGYLARKLGSQTEIGAYLDPIADKALLVSIYVALAANDLLPVWLAILVATRDALIVGGVILARLVEQPLVMKPLWISKLNTSVQILLAGLTLGLLAFQWHADTAIDICIAAVVVLTLASGAFYLRDWVRHISSAESPANDKDTMP